MRILIGIASYKRPEKLIRLIDSILSQTYRDYDIGIVFDNNDYNSEQAIKEIYGNLINTVVNKSQKYVIGCWNKIYELSANKFDGILTLCDDVEMVNNDVLKHLTSCMESNFPDFDGVVGLTQVYPDHPEVFFQPTGQVLVGSKFLNRYKPVNYQLCCPAYNHWYQDEELLMFSSKLNRFKSEPLAKIYHHHPAYYPKEMDKTHTETRGNLIQQQDKDMYIERKFKGLVWGDSWKI